MLKNIIKILLCLQLFLIVVCHMEYDLIDKLNEENDENDDEIENIVTPNELPGLILWLTGDSIPGNNNDPIATWDDRSGNGNDFTQVTAVNRPLKILNGFNGFPVARFDGGNDYLDSLNNIMTTANFTIISFARTGGVDGETIFSDRGTDIDEILQLYSTGANQQMRVYTSDDIATILGVTNTAINISNTFHIGTVRRYGDYIDLYINGTGNTTNLAAYDETTTWTLGVPARIGCNYNVTGFLNGDIAELIIYNRSISNNERRDIEHYLNAKYDAGLGL